MGIALIGLLAAVAACRRDVDTVAPQERSTASRTPPETGPGATGSPVPEKSKTSLATSSSPETTGEPQTTLDLMEVLEINLHGATEWRAGDEVTFRIEVTNHADQPVRQIEVQGSVQFGLQDTISEARWTIPIGELAAGKATSTVLSYVSTRPGVWYVKAALYQNAELIKATARTVYVREVETAPPAKKLEDDDASLGPPLVANPERLQRLHPEYPIWIDMEGRAVVMIGRVCQREAPLELFACLKNTKEHESVVSINTRAYIVHAGLLALGVEPGRPAQFYPEFRPAEGPEIEVLVAWKDPDGTVHTVPAQQWVREVQSKQPMKTHWIFTGSQLLKDEETGKQYYYADTTGELICVSNFPSAVLDLPIRSTDANEALLFEAFTENIPPLGTPVTVILKPKSPPGGDSATESEPPSPRETPPDGDKPDSPSSPNPPAPNPSNPNPKNVP